MSEQTDGEDNDETKYDLTPEEATSLEGSGKGAGLFNRKKVLVFLLVGLAAVIMLGVLVNYAKSSKKTDSDDIDEYAQTRVNSDFVRSLSESGLRNANRSNSETLLPDENENNFAEQPESLYPVPRNGQQQPPQEPDPRNYSGGAYQQQQRTTYLESSLIPKIQGSIFASGASGGGGQNYQSQSQSYSSASPYDDYLNSLNARANSYGALGQTNSAQSYGQVNQDFYNSTSNSGAVYGGQFLGDDSIWTGTIISGVLETAINTDLPGQVLARVTRNVYDSKSGRNLLIPQGSILIARYNSSVSYAQNRVQIIWDTLIRPDGYQINLEGANGVDREGMSGQDAVYHGNFFEYVKAAGIITLFSIASGKINENVERFGSKNETVTSSMAEANAQFFNQLGQGLVSQAMNVQPTLTVDNGTLINIMLNKSIYLPRVSGYAPNQKYILE